MSHVKITIGSVVFDSILKKTGRISDRKNQHYLVELFDGTTVQRMRDEIRDVTKLWKGGTMQVREREQREILAQGNCD